MKKIIAAVTAAALIHGIAAIITVLTFNNDKESK